ncbi:MAG: GNAT family N-acetyltransferase [Candidatus Zixiibacteriota bacterium]
MSCALITAPLPESRFDEWNRLVAGSPQGSIYSTSMYLDTLCRATGGSFRIIASSKGDNLVGGIGLYETSTAYGPSVSNRLLLYYNGIVLRDYKSKYPSQEASRQIETLTALERYLLRCGYPHILIHNRSTVTDLRPFCANGWTIRPGYTYVVPLVDMDAQWGRVEQNLRRLITRCENNNITFTDDDDFDSFFRLHYQVHQRKGAPLYLSRNTFRIYFDSLRAHNLCRLFQARLPDGRSVAAQLVLTGDHPVSHTVCAGADGHYLNTGCTPFLRWKSFCALAKLGYRANDLTDAALNSVTRFKSQLGGTLEATSVISHTGSRAYRIDRSLRSALQRTRSLVSSAVRVTVKKEQHRR